MIIEVKTQKNGTIVIRAPGGDVFTFKLDPAKKAEVFQEIGETLLTMLADPEQPPEVVAAGHIDDQGHAVEDHKLPPVPENAGQPEVMLRGFLDSLFPGASAIIGKMQEMSGDGDK